MVSRPFPSLWAAAGAVPGAARAGKPKSCRLGAASLLFASALMGMALARIFEALGVMLRCLAR